MDWVVWFFRCKFTKSTRCMEGKIKSSLSLEQYQCSKVLFDIRNVKNYTLRLWQKKNVSL